MHGIARLEEYVRDTAFSPMLRKGLNLVRAGMEPHIIESILLNTAVANDADLLESLIITEGVISIQILCSPDVTMELLLSYFSFDSQEQLREELREIKINRAVPLSTEEVEKLLSNR